MLRYHNFDIVFQEVPGEVTLALNLTGCPNRCPGCHSPHLQAVSGQVLDEAELRMLIQQYGRAVTCICFMGGDAVPEELVALVENCTEDKRFKWAWYSGKTRDPKDFPVCFDFVKTGPYDPEKGGLASQLTNQRFYTRTGGDWLDKTCQFIRPGR